MTSPINPRDLKDEELIDIVKTSTEKIEFDPFDHIQEFILLFNIKEGEDKVYTQDIYRVYKDWMGQSGKLLLPIPFAKRFAKYFRHRKIKGTSKKAGYLLDGTPFNDSPKAQELMKKAFEKRNKLRDYTTNKKKTNVKKEKSKKKKEAEPRSVS